MHINNQRTISEQRKPTAQYLLKITFFCFLFSIPTLNKVEKIHNAVYFNRLSVANSRENVTECLRELISSSELDSILAKVNQEDQWNSLVTRYLHDFIHMVYLPLGPEELEVRN